MLEHIANVLPYTGMMVFGNMVFSLFNLDVNDLNDLSTFVNALTEQIKSGDEGHFVCTKEFLSPIVQLMADESFFVAVVVSSKVSSCELLRSVSAQTERYNPCNGNANSMIITVYPATSHMTYNFLKLFDEDQTSLVPTKCFSESYVK